MGREDGEHMLMKDFNFLFYWETRLHPASRGVSKSVKRLIYLRAPLECFPPHRRLPNERINTFNVGRKISPRFGLDHKKRAIITEIPACGAQTEPEP